MSLKTKSKPKTKETVEGIAEQDRSSQDSEDQSRHQKRQVCEDGCVGPGCENRIANTGREVVLSSLFSSPFTTKGDSLDKSQDQIEVEAPVYRIERKGGKGAIYIKYPHYTF